MDKLYLKEKEVALMTGKAISTLRNERCLRKGIPYLKPKDGRSIYYKLQDVCDYMESQRIAFE